MQLPELGRRAGVAQSVVSAYEADLLEIAVDVVPSDSLKPRVRVAVDREAVAL